MPLEQNHHVRNISPTNLSIMTSGALPAKVCCPSCGAMLTMPAQKVKSPMDHFRLRVNMTCVCSKTINIMMRR